MKKSIHGGRLSLVLATGLTLVTLLLPMTAGAGEAPAPAAALGAEFMTRAENFMHGAMYLRFEPEVADAVFAHANVQAATDLLGMVQDFKAFLLGMSREGMPSASVTRLNGLAAEAGELEQKVAMVLDQRQAELAFVSGTGPDPTLIAQDMGVPPAAAAEFGCSGFIKTFQCHVDDAMGMHDG